ncbi:hypothetical protein PMIT1320_00117 [Prochlorococcus marinus str. MIT 1320]|nr:hypothetical protein PMIT1320_00117 [Prochlorococcus marinus str. MIT 1320]
MLNRKKYFIDVLDQPGQFSEFFCGLRSLAEVAVQKIPI